MSRPVRSSRSIRSSGSCTPPMPRARRRLTQYVLMDGREVVARRGRLAPFIHASALHRWRCRREKLMLLGPPGECRSAATRQASARSVHEYSTTSGYAGTAAYAQPCDVARAEVVWSLLWRRYGVHN